MSQQKLTFKEFVNTNFEKLDLFTTAITRAHGKNHPEAFDVRKLFEAIHEKINESGPNIPTLDDELKQLRTVTNDYKIPNDVCETYASVYEMLQTLDQLYHAS